MKLSVLIVGLIWLVPAVYSQETRRSTNKEALTVADQYYWAGSEGNLAIEFVGKFQSEEKLIEMLNFRKEIREFKAKKDPFKPRAWELRDILIFMDLNANGNVVTWRVSGPEPLIQGYVEDLRKRYADRTVFYDFSYTYLPIRPSSE